MSQGARKRLIVEGVEADDPVVGRALWTLEVLEVEQFPPEVAALFPHDVRDKWGRLTPVPGIGLATHLRRLDAVREQLRAVYRTMTPGDFRRARRLPAYDVTPEWVIHHLAQHEAEHRGQIGMLRELAGQARGPR